MLLYWAYRDVGIGRVSGQRDDESIQANWVWVRVRVKVGVGVRVRVRVRVRVSVRVRSHHGPEQENNTVIFR